MQWLISEAFPLQWQLTDDIIVHYFANGNDSDDDDDNNDSDIGS